MIEILDVSHLQKVEQGAEQKAIETAKKLLQDNLPIEQIVKYTDLPLEKVQELANNTNK